MFLFLNVTHLVLSMFHVKALPSPEESRSESSKKQPPGTNGDAAPKTDADTELALALQPLLEQEALLETFVEEAMAQRKFEDVKTLKGNLAEIRAEIEKMAAI